MRALNVALITLGHQKQPVDIGYLKGWRSRIFLIGRITAIAHSPDATGDTWEYPDDQLSELIKAVPAADMTVAIVSAPVAQNFYSRRLKDNVVVLSLHEIAHILNSANFRLEHFVLRNIYQFSVYYHALGGTIPTVDSVSWSHDDIRGCLFDMNSQKSDILYSMDQPKLCEVCRTRLGSYAVDPEFLPALTSELQRLRKRLYFRMADWVKSHPIYALVITAAFGIPSQRPGVNYFRESKEDVVMVGLTSGSRGGVETRSVCD